ncbi:MAG: zinc-binding dehydrogenase [Actinomycetota bacterium]
MRALEISRKVGKFAVARLVSPISTSGAASIGPLALVKRDPPALPGAPGWSRIRPRLTGICGSDLVLVEGHASTYFDDWVSFPFVPGHEIVADGDDGRRVVLEPVLGHAARGLPPPFEGAAPGDGDDYAHLVCGHLKPGIQTGFCQSTGGGWSTELIAHESQLHDVPDAVTDEQALLVEPAAGGIHAALAVWPHVHAARERGETPVVAVLGGGTMGLCAVAGLVRYLPDARVIVGARYPHQQALARHLGAHVVVPAPDLARAVRREVGCHVVGDYLSGGAHASIDAVGTSESIADCLRLTRPRGRIVLLGMPAQVSVDLTGLWHRETIISGAYTYGTETMPDGRRARTFDLALETVASSGLDRLLSATYRLEEYRDALAHAAHAGRRGAVKIAFDFRSPVVPDDERSTTKETR